MYLCTDDFFTLNSAVPMERQVLDFPCLPEEALAEGKDIYARS